MENLKRHLLFLFNNISEYFDSFLRLIYIYVYIYIYIYIYIICSFISFIIQYRVVSHTVKERAIDKSVMKN